MIAGRDNGRQAGRCMSSAVLLELSRVAAALVANRSVVDNFPFYVDAHLAVASSQHKGVSANLRCHAVLIRTRRLTHPASTRRVRGLGANELLARAGSSVATGYHIDAASTQ
ncbi:hypothetical protein BKA62DRAFT_708786 [Auriculariales sp. MPI-PUGE-AT-0066]|nr:hypothetical protein BKA62DRAFT_708786 [Auriculariales sp. MPI-PUGE-AT-0066]